MKVQPVRGYRPPHFPTHAILDAHPELLHLVPARWRGNRAVLTALAFACGLVLTGCGSHSSSTMTPSASRVAPLFLHGQGWGGFGCVAQNPPVFLSEEEGRQVILQEAARAGLTFTPDAVTVPALLPSVSYNQPPEQWRRRLASLALDGSDAARRISFEFVSAADHDAWAADSPMASFWSEDVVGAAQVLRDGLAVSPEGTYAVFYEPMESVDASMIGTSYEEWDAKVDAAMEQDRDELRAQVRDFIAWLQAEGII